MSDAGPDEEALRRLIRELLASMVPPDAATGEADDGRSARQPVAAPSGGDPVSPQAGEAPGAPETVVLRDDRDLAAFVQRLLVLFDNPKRRQDLRTGRLRFRLAGAPSGPGGGALHRVERGPVTERMVARAAAAGARLVLGPDAVVTPLARDRARSSGVPIEKERP